MTPRLSLILPVFNESRRLEKGLSKAVRYLLAQKYSWEIIVVDDGSTDSTPLIYSRFIHHYPQLPVYYMRIAHNFGKGHAVRVGVEAAGGNIIIFSDIDFSVSLDHIPFFLTALDTADIAIASRRLFDSKVTKHQPKIRESLGKGFTELSNKILGLHHTDLTCGFKGFRNNKAKKLFSLQHLNGWAFDSEILYLAHKLTMKVTEISVIWKNDPLTKVNMLKDIITSSRDLFRIKLWNG